MCDASLKPKMLKLGLDQASSIGIAGPEGVSVPAFGAAGRDERAREMRRINIGGSADGLWGKGRMMKPHSGRQ
jgi:hypothetical protein